MTPVASCGIQRRAERLSLIGSEQHPHRQADLKALADEAQPTWMVARGVTKEVGVVGGEECLAAEGGDARSATVAETRSGLDDEFLVGGKPRFSEAIAEASTEVHILPPCGLEGGVEATQGLPHGAAHKQRSGGWLCAGLGSFGWL